jgi:hypothetical protein
MDEQDSGILFSSLLYSWLFTAHVCMYSFNLTTCSIRNTYLLAGNSRHELATTWEHYRFAPAGSHGTAQGAVAHDFLVSIFFIYFFFITLSVLMCFLLYILFYSYVLGCPPQATAKRTHLRSSTPLLKRS